MGSMWQAKPLSVASLWPFCRLFNNFLGAIHHNFTKLMIPAIKFFSASCANWNKDPYDFRTCLYLKYTEIRAVPEILCNLNTRQFTGIFRSDDIYSLIHAIYSYFGEAKDIMNCIRRQGASKHRGPDVHKNAHANSNQQHEGIFYRMHWIWNRILVSRL